MRPSAIERITTPVSEPAGPFPLSHGNDDSLENMPEFTFLKEEPLLFTLDKPDIASVHGYILVTLRCFYLVPMSY